MLFELKAGDSKFTAELTSKGTYVSPATEKTLLRLSVEFNTTNEQQRDKIHTFIALGKRVETVADTGSTTQWRIGENSHSFTSGSPITRFRWELLQVQELNLEQLIIDGWKLSPYKYDEEFDSKGVLKASARVELTKEEYERLQALPTYFQVIRKGINDKAREMRLGQILWSEKGGRLKIGFHLVDRSLDESGETAIRFLIDPEATNLVRSVAESLVRFSNLADLLVSKGILSASEIEQVRTIEKERIGKELDQFTKVEDLDEWLSK